MSSSSASCPCPDSSWRSEEPHPAVPAGVVRAANADELECPCPPCVEKVNGVVTNIKVGKGNGLFTAADCPSSSSVSPASSVSGSSISIPSLGSASVSSSSKKKKVEVIFCDPEVLYELSTELVLTVTSSGALAWPVGSVVHLFFEREFRVLIGTGTGTNTYRHYWIWKAEDIPPNKCTYHGFACACCNLYYFIWAEEHNDAVTDELLSVGTMAWGTAFGDAIDETPTPPTDPPYVVCATTAAGGRFYNHHLITGGVGSICLPGVPMTPDDVFGPEWSFQFTADATFITSIDWTCAPLYGATDIFDISFNGFVEQVT